MAPPALLLLLGGYQRLAGAPGDAQHRDERQEPEGSQGATVPGCDGQAGRPPPQPDGQGYAGKARLRVWWCVYGCMVVNGGEWLYVWWCVVVCVWMYGCVYGCVYGSVRIGVPMMVCVWPCVLAIFIGEVRGHRNYVGAGQSGTRSSA